jgi:hypothetical protein
VSDGGIVTVSEKLRLQQVYATLVNFGGAELADRIGYQRAHAADAALDLGGVAAGPGAVAGRQDPDHAGKPRAGPRHAGSDRL